MVCVLADFFCDDGCEVGRMWRVWGAGEWGRGVRDWLIRLLRKVW